MPSTRTECAGPGPGRSPRWSRAARVATPRRPRVSSTTAERWRPSRLGVALALALALSGCPRRLVMRPEPQDPVRGVPDLSSVEQCGAFDAAALMECVSPARVAADIEHVAKSRPSASPHHRVVRDTCRDRLSALGYETRLLPYPTGENVVGSKTGFTKPNEVVVVGAHYDQLEGCPGADDNASGVAAVLEVARVLSSGRFDRSLVVACWDEGERGQLGSRAHARQAREQGTAIVLAVSFEAIAFSRAEKNSQTVPEGFEQLFPDEALALLEDDHRADFLTVVAESASEPWARRVVHHGAQRELEVHVLTLTERMKVKQKKLHRSDHASFWDEGYPAMLVTDSGPFRNDRIGCAHGQDSPSTLDFAFAGRVVRASVGALAEVLEVR